MSFTPADSYILPSQNSGTTAAYFNSLPAVSIHRKYYEGTAKYESPKGFLKKIKHAFFDQTRLFNELLAFYPGQRTLLSTKTEWDHDSKETLEYSIGITAVSIFAMFNMARRGYVLPVLREYGFFFATHRIFRQYFHAAVLPVSLLTAWKHYSYYNHFEVLNNIHANRLEKKMLTDPAGSFFPDELTTPERMDL